MSDPEHIVLCPVGMLFAWFRIRARDGAAIERISYWFGELRTRHSPKKSQK